MRIWLASVLLLASCSIRTDYDVDNMHSIAAVRRLIEIRTSQDAYRSERGRYAIDFAELNPNLGKPRAGYAFRMTAQSDGYTVHADPVTRLLRRAARNFYLDQNGEIRESYSGKPATAQSPKIR